MNTPVLRFARLAAVSSITFLAGCAVSTDYDKQVGAQSAQAVAIQMGIYDMESLQEYVDKVGQNLVSHLGDQPFEFQFHVVDDPNPNAFALPGGYIYITRGLLMLMNSEDELAGVLGHEISHVTQRHSVKQMRSSVVPGLLEVPGNIVGVVSDDLGNLINAPISAGNDLLLAGYSRSHETEADTLGATLAAKAGYDPKAMGDVLTRMNSAIEYVTQKEIEKSYFDSHPFTPDRVVNINDISGKLTVADLQPIDNTFPQPLDGMVVGENPDKGVFIDNHFYHPTIAFAIDLPEKWQTVNQPLAVGAFNEKEQGLVVLSGVNNKYDAKQNADRFKFAVEDRYNMEVKIEPIELADGNTGYLSTLEAKEKQEVTYLNQMWVDHGEGTFRIAGVAKPGTQEQAISAIKSFRSMVASDYDKLSVQRLSVAQVDGSQSLEALNKQLEGIADLKLLKIINGVEESADTTSLPRVKVVTESTYPRPQ